MISSWCMCYCRMCNDNKFDNIIQTTVMDTLSELTGMGSNS